MKKTLTQLAMSISLTLLSASASAAGVLVETFLVTSGADNVLNIPGTCAVGIRTNSECVRFSEDVTLGSPLVDTGTETAVRSTFFDDDGLRLPSYVMNVDARAFGSLGQLHASTFAQIQGTGGGVDVSIGGRAHAQVTDSVRVRSSVLPDGSTVSIKARIDVSGSGGGRLWFTAAGTLTQVDLASDSPANIDSLEDFEATFSAKVGDLVKVTFGLTAFTRTVSNGWGAADILNGRNNSANYGNSAFLYMEGVDPTLGISLDNGTAYSYAFPTAVPVPGAALMLLSALPLAWRIRAGAR